MKTAFAAIVACLTAIGTAHALPTADGSFTLNPTGSSPITVDTGDITLATGSRTVPAWLVGTVTPNLTLALSSGMTATFSSTSLIVPAGTATSKPVSFTLDVGALTFAFDTGVTNSRVALDTAHNVAGSFSDQFSGTLTNGGGVFATGSPVSLSETCTQPSVRGKAGLINCGDSVVTIGAVPEPGSLALLGTMLVGAGILVRRRRSWA